MASTSSLQLLKRCTSDGYLCYNIPIPAVIGIVFGCAFVFITLCFVAFLCIKRRRYKKRVREEGEEAAGEYGVMSYNGTKRGERIDFNPNAY